MAVKHVSAGQAGCKAFVGSASSDTLESVSLFARSRRRCDMDIFLWLLIAILVLVPGKAAERGVGFDTVRSLALLLGILYLLSQASG